MKDPQTHLLHLPLPHHTISPTNTPIPGHQPFPLFPYPAIHPSRLDTTHSWRRRSLHSQDGELQKVECG